MTKGRMSDATILHRYLQPKIGRLFRYESNVYRRRRRGCESGRYTDRGPKWNYIERWHRHTGLQAYSDVLVPREVLQYNI